jgi:hypothetical protein
MRIGLLWFTIFLWGTFRGSEASYIMHKVNSGGCPYTATWLCHIDHFKRIHYEAYWAKMETAGWDALKFANSYQLRDENDYFVNHMSQYEHNTRKKFGYEKAEKMVEEMSNAAVASECVAELTTRGYHNTSLAVIPFYGGRPPNVTADLKVQSLGQGNSLVCVKYVCTFEYYEELKLNELM